MNFTYSSTDISCQESEEITVEKADVLKRKSPTTDKTRSKDGRAEEGRRRQERTRGKILSCSLDCFVRQGYRATTIEKILNASGVSRASLYAHFRNKTEIMRALLDEFIERIDAELIQIRYGDERSETDQILDTINRVVELFERNKSLGRIVFLGTMEADENLRGVLDRFFSRVEEMIAHALKLGIEQGLIRPVHLETGTRAILGSFKEAVLLPLARGKISAARAKKLAEHLLNYHMFGLSKAAPSSRAIAH